MLVLKCAPSARFEVRPYLGDLEWARGIVPTPRGEVKVSLRREKEKVHLELSVPEGTEAVVSGRTYGAGMHRIELE